MNIDTGQLYPTIKEAMADAKPGERIVEVRGDEASIGALSADIGKLRAIERRRAKNKRARTSRVKNRRSS